MAPMPNQTDAIVYFYNLAVALSGAWLATLVGSSDRLTLLGIAAFASIIWTVYFKFGMVNRIASRADESSISPDN